MGAPSHLLYPDLDADAFFLWKLAKPAKLAKSDSPLSDVLVETDIALARLLI